MINEFDPEIINEFRKKVHEHNDFIRLYFVDYNAKDSVEGKDVWSKICSCMDWLTVTVAGIERPKSNSNMDITSLNFTHFLVTIDMVVEAVNHLWLSIGQVNNVKQPFIYDRSVFYGNEFDEDYTDERYFKEIRSWFGIHAVNGNEVRLKGFSKGVRFFSSWSSNLINEDEFSINLYSNNREAEKKYGGRKTVKIESLIKFGSLRYNTLIKLMNEIDRLYLNEKERLQNTPVQYNPDDTEITQLQKLYQQSQERKLTAEHYEHAIQDYISFLSCDMSKFNETDKRRVSKYLHDLKTIIPTYYKIVQEVDDSEYEVFELLYTRSKIRMDNHYDYSKVLEYANGGNNFYTAKTSLESLIKKGLLPTYCINIPISCLYLLIHAIDYEWYLTEQRK